MVHGCELILACSRQQCLQHIDNVPLLISGRFYHRIAAVFLHTPSIAMASNHPQISALSQMLELSCFIDSQSTQLAQCLMAFSKKVSNKHDCYLLKKCCKEIHWR